METFIVLVIILVILVWAYIRLVIRPQDKIAADKKAEEYRAAELYVQARIESDKFRDDLNARSKQMWENMRVGQEWIEFLSDEQHRRLQWHLEVMNLPEDSWRKKLGFFGGLLIFPIQTVYHPETQRYKNAADFLKQRDEYIAHMNKDWPELI